MLCRSRTRQIHARLGVLVALFMVFALPVCWYGALERAQAANVAGPSNSNNNEEREEHEHDEEGRVERLVRRSPAPPPVSRVATDATPARCVPIVPSIVGSIAPPRDLSRFSERRLI